MPPTNAPRSRLSTRAMGFITPAIVWAVWFVLTYSLQGAGCSAGLQDVALAGVDVLRILLAVPLLAAALTIAWLGLAGRRSMRRLSEGGGRTGEPRRFFAKLTLLSCGLFFVATLWVGFGVFFLAPCQ